MALLAKQLKIGRTKKKITNHIITPSVWECWSFLPYTHNLFHYFKAGIMRYHVIKGWLIFLCNT